MNDDAQVELNFPPNFFEGPDPEPVHIPAYCMSNHSQAESYDEDDALADRNDDNGTNTARSGAPPFSPPFSENHPDTSPPGPDDDTPKRPEGARGAHVLGFQTRETDPGSISFGLGPARWPDMHGASDNSLPATPTKVRHNVAFPQTVPARPRTARVASSVQNGRLNARKRLRSASLSAALEEDHDHRDDEALQDGSAPSRAQPPREGRSSQPPAPATATANGAPVSAPPAQHHIDLSRTQNAAQSDVRAVGAVTRAPMPIPLHAYPDHAPSYIPFELANNDGRRGGDGLNNAWTPSPASSTTEYEHLPMYLPGGANQAEDGRAFTNAARGLSMEKTEQARAGVAPYGEEPAYPHTAPQHGPPFQPAPLSPADLERQMAVLTAMTAARQQEIEVLRRMQMSWAYGGTQNTGASHSTPSHAATPGEISGALGGEVWDVQNYTRAESGPPACSPHAQDDATLRAQDTMDVDGPQRAARTEPPNYPATGAPLSGAVSMSAPVDKQEAPRAERPGPFAPRIRQPRVVIVSKDGVIELPQVEDEELVAPDENEEPPTLPRIFPARHAMAPGDIYRNVGRSKEDGWADFIKKDPHCNFLFQVHGQLPNAEEEYVQKLMKTIVTTLAHFTGLDEALIKIAGPDFPTQTNRSESARSFPFTWMWYNVPPEAAQRAQTTDIILGEKLTLYIDHDHDKVPLFVTSLIGFRRTDAKEIKKDIVDTYMEDGPREATARAVFGEDGEIPNAVYKRAEAIIRDIRVDVHIIKSSRSKTASEVIVSVYSTPPTNDDLKWIKWREYMRKTRIKSIFDSKANFRLPTRCNGCHAGDHVRAECPFEKISAVVTTPLVDDDDDEDAEIDGEAEGAVEEDRAARIPQAVAGQPASTLPVYQYPSAPAPPAYAPALPPSYPGTSGGMPQAPSFNQWQAYTPQQPYQQHQPYVPQQYTLAPVPVPHRQTTNPQPTRHNGIKVLTPQHFQQNARAGSSSHESRADYGERDARHDHEAQSSQSARGRAGGNARAGAGRSKKPSRSQGYPDRR